MCLATPLKIKEIKGEKAVVESGDHDHTIDLSLIKDPKIGDYVLVHGEMAINKVDEKDAKKILEIVNGK
jgi:hydrogenase expression/formation protein HypC